MTPEGILIQCFFPEEEKVSLRTLSDRKLHAMTRRTEAISPSFFREKDSQIYLCPGDKKEGREIYDPMPFPPRLRRRRRRVSRRASVMTSMRNWEPIP